MLRDTFCRNSNVPWFITGYWKPNTKDNYDEFYQRKNRGDFSNHGSADFSKVSYIRDVDNHYNPDRYKDASRDIEDIIDRELYKPVLHNFVPQLTNACYDTNAVLYIRVNGYTDSNRILVHDPYIDTTVRQPGGETILQNDPLLTPSANSEAGQWGNIRLSTIRAYWTLRTIREHLRDNSDDFKKLDDAKPPRVIMTFEGRGIDTTSRLNTGYNRRVDVEAWIGKRHESDPAMGDMKDGSGN
jgi:hypothetical protein